MPSTPLRPTWLLIALLAASGARPAAVAELCPAPTLPDPALPAPRDPADPRLSVDAARSESSTDSPTILEGDVRAVQGARTLRADRIEYQRASGALRAEGGLRYRDDRVALSGERAEFELGTDAGRFLAPVFEFVDRPGRGSAAELRALDADRVVIETVRFTGCPPGDESWTLAAEQLRIDRATGKGEADDVLVRFKGVPLFYTPWLSFPVDDRRLTGFLPPQLSGSERHGTELRLPWYWNIAPERDATIAFRPMTKRGLMLENELRYLGQRHRGVVDLEVLSNDAVTGEPRAYGRVRHRSAFGASWTLDLDLAAVSDPQYFEDFGSSLVATTQAYLPRRIDLLSSGTHYAFRARLLDYAITDPTVALADEPYGKLPQLALVAATERGQLGLAYDLGVELTSFTHDLLVEGVRLDLKPRVSLPLRGPGWFATPALAWRHTSYALSDDPLFPDATDRALPLASFDAGLLFERDLAWGGGMLQTLEPRLFYLYVPYRDQSDVPLFDTAIPDVHVHQLFRDNRFIGADRQADANQLAAALTSRLIEPGTGRVVLEASLGQISYFADRRVTLGAAPETLARSELIAEVASDMTADLSVSAAAVFDPEHLDTARSNLAVRWRPSDRERVDFSYRFRRGSVEQLDLAVVWPLAPRWRGIARWNYSLLDEATLESLAGIEYESCCWALRIGTRRYVFNRTGETDQTIFLQLELKGLARVGEPLEELLERGTSTYGIPENL